MATAPADWDISRDAPYSVEIPDAPASTVSG
jgi:hypothetical protein